MPLVTGKLTDFGLDPMEGNKPRIIFKYSSPGLSGVSVLATKQVEVTPAHNGYFEAELAASAKVAPAGYYRIMLAWTDRNSAQRKTEELPWKLYVPAAGGSLADLLRVPSNPALVWTGEEPPANPSPGSWWQNPATGDLAEYSGTGWNHKANLRGPAGYNATGAAEDDTAISRMVKQEAGPTKTRQELDRIYSTPEALDALRQRLDIWPAFDLLGGNADSWDASDYPKYLAGIDNMMAPAITAGKVARQVYGTATGGDPLVRFTAGPVNAPHVFLGGGMHGIELVANHAAMRFFQGFVYSDHPAMRALRSRVRISWVPSSNPTSYRYGRASSTGVDINRNFPWGWEYYPTDDVNRYKGPAPLSEPESRALFELFKAEDFRMMFDCHCVGASAEPQFSIAPGGSWITTNRALPHGVLSRWAATYNTDKAVTYGELGDGNGGDPTFKTWAAKYMRYDRKHEDSFSMTVEASDRMHGSTATLTTRRALSSYCGFIALLLADWLEAGHLPPSPVVMSQYATTYTAPDAAVAPENPNLDPAIGKTIIDGGQWVNTNTLTPFPWQAVRGTTGVDTIDGQRRRFVDVAIKNPGFLVVEVSGQFEASTTTKEDFLVEYAIAAGPAPADGGNVPVKPESYRRAIIPGVLNHPNMASGVGVPFSTRVVIPFAEMPSTPLFRLQLMVRRTSGTRLHTFSVRRADLTATLYPNTITDPLPRVALTR